MPLQSFQKIEKREKCRWEFNTQKHLFLNSILNSEERSSNRGLLVFEKLKRLFLLKGSVEEVSAGEKRREEKRNGGVGASSKRHELGFVVCVIIGSGGFTLLKTENKYR